MGKIIESILSKWFCCHNWDVLHQYQIFSKNNTGELPNRTIVHMYCTKCGKIKKLNNE